MNLPEIAQATPYAIPDWWLEPSRNSAGDVTGTQPRADIAGSVLERLAAGDTFAEAIAQWSGLTWQRVLGWRRKFPEFARALQEALEMQREVWLYECKGIADDGSRDYAEREGRPVYDAEHVQRAKLRIDTRLKLLAIIDPAKYGPRVNLDVSVSIAERMTVARDRALKREVREHASRGLEHVEAMPAPDDHPE